MKKKYIHYGNTKYIPEIFFKISNEPMFVKPLGGLWASPVDSPYGWKSWNMNNVVRACREDNSFTFSLTEDANILHISSAHDLAPLPKQNFPRSPLTHFPVWLDFEELCRQGYDAIELHYSKEVLSIEDILSHTTLYYALYGWDCDCILVMNKDVIGTD